MKIVIFGHVCIDHNVLEGKSFVGAGSPAMFMHRIFSQLPDCNVTIVAPYGPDFSSYVGMSRFYPESPQPIQTMIYENTVTGGIRTQRCLNADKALPVPIDDTIQQMISTADSICIAPLSSNFPSSYVQQIAAIKKWKTQLTLLPQGYFRQFDADHHVKVREFIEADAIIPLVDTVIISDKDYTNASETASRWARESNATVVMTQAEKGATIFSGKETTEVTTYPVSDSDIISSIGAGDIFSAGYMYAFAKSKDAQKAVAFGNALAGQCLAFPPDNIRIDITKLPVC